MRWDIGVDLGTKNIWLAEQKAGPVLGEAATLAFREGENRPFATGDEAQALEGRACAGVSVHRPLKDGTLQNPFHAQCLLEWAFARSEALQGTKHFSALITCSPSSRPVQSEALAGAAVEAGAADAALVRSDAAVALGAGLDILSPQGCMVLDLGAGGITATLFTLGRVADYAALPYGMSRIDQRIQNSVRTRLGYAISPHSAEELKLSMGAASLQYAAMGAPMSIAGLDVAERLPREFSVPPSLVVEACLDVSREIAAMAASIVDAAPAELAADLNDTGVVLAGGGALLSGLDKLIGDALSVPCRVADVPASCGVRGLHAIMQAPERYRGFFLDAARSAWR